MHNFIFSIFDRYTRGRQNNRNTLQYNIKAPQANKAFWKLILLSFADKFSVYVISALLYVKQSKSRVVKKVTSANTLKLNHVTWGEKRETMGGLRMSRVELSPDCGAVVFLLFCPLPVDLTTFLFKQKINMQINFLAHSSKAPIVSVILE